MAPVPGLRHADDLWDVVVVHDGDRWDWGGGGTSRIGDGTLFVSIDAGGPSRRQPTSRVWIQSPCDLSALTTMIRSASRSGLIPRLLGSSLWCESCNGPRLLNSPPMPAAVTLQGYSSGSGIDVRFSSRESYESLPTLARLAAECVAVMRARVGWGVPISIWFSISSKRLRSERCFRSCFLLKTRVHPGPAPSQTHNFF